MSYSTIYAMKGGALAGIAAASLLSAAALWHTREVVVPTTYGYAVRNRWTGAVTVCEVRRLADWTDRRNFAIGHAVAAAAPPDTRTAEQALDDLDKPAPPPTAAEIAAAGGAAVRFGLDDPLLACTRAAIVDPAP